MIRPIDQTPSMSDSTSALRSPSSTGTIKIAGIIAGATLMLGAGTASSLSHDFVQTSKLIPGYQSTNSGEKAAARAAHDPMTHDPMTTAESIPSTRSAVAELRRLSGLTWDKLSEIFEVNRRSLHLWASGKPMNQANEEQLRQTLAAIRDIDRGRAATNRSLLLTPVDGETTPFDLLKEKRFQEFVNLLGQGEGRDQTPRIALSLEERASRRPLPPETLLSARPEPVHTMNGPERTEGDEA